MATRITTTIGLPVPDDFPLEAYEKVHAVVTRYITSSHELFPDYAGAWNAIVYRFVACREYSLGLTQSLKDYGGAPAPAERYKQERSLFGFFTSGFAVLESAYYGCHAIGAIVTPSAFPMSTEEERKMVNPRSTCNRFQKQFPNEDLTRAIDATLADPEYEEWRDIRNVLSHRVAPARTIHGATISHAGPTVWNLRDLVLEPDLTHIREIWLSTSLARLLSATAEFVTRYMSV